MEAYKHTFVEGNTDDSELLEESRNQWDTVIAPSFVEELKQHTYISGEKFTACDIMVLFV